MAGRRVVVVGGGVAGVSAALAASAHGAKTTLVDSSKKVGLSRAMLPLLISGGWTEDDVVLPQAKALAERGVEVRTLETVASVQHREMKVILGSSSGRATSIGFDSLVICAGATSEVPQLRGISRQNVFVLKEAADYLRLSAGLDALQTVVVSGPIPLALRLAEILVTRGKRVQVYCGNEGLQRQFSKPVAGAIRRAAAASHGEDALSLLDESVDSVLGVDKAEAVVSGGSVRTCDAVLVLPRGVPSVPIVDCEKGRNGGLLVDASMSTSMPEVFAAGDSAEIRFKAGSVPARLYSTSRMGGEVAGTNAAGGWALAAPSWAVEQTYFGLEFCSAGLGEEEASSMGLDAATESIETRSGEDERRDILVSMVYDRGTHQVYGLQVAGWRASSLSNAASLIVSLGLSVERLLHIESPYSPGLGFEDSPIALTARKIHKQERA